jgi:hypothetical protein
VDSASCTSPVRCPAHRTKSDSYVLLLNLTYLALLTFVAWGRFAPVVP